MVCGGAPSTVVDLAIFEPAAGVEPAGVIVFGSGGGGTGYYNYPDRAALLAAGYTLVERQWQGDAGWFEGGDDGPSQTSCRLGAVLRHLRSTLAPASTPLCATGNSGGSAELVYALTWNGAGDVLDFALPTSGPFHRLDLACAGDDDPAWPQQCIELKADRCPDCTSLRCQASGGILALLDSSFGDDTCSNPGVDDLAVLQARSPANGPHLDSIDIPVHLIVGKLDDGPFAALVSALHDEMLAAGVDVTLQFLDDAGHEMDQFAAGEAAITAELLANCR